MTERRKRVLGQVIAGVLVALPGAYATVQSRYQARRETVEAVNMEKGDEIARLQVWVRANQASLGDLRVEIAALRREAEETKREFTRLLLRVARDRRVLRGVSVPEGDREATPAAVQRRVEELIKPPPSPEPRRKKPRSLPVLRAPSRSLEQVEKKAGL